MFRKPDSHSFIKFQSCMLAYWLRNPDINRLLMFGQFHVSSTKDHFGGKVDFRNNISLSFCWIFFSNSPRINWLATMSHIVNCILFLLCTIGSSMNRNVIRKFSWMHVSVSKAHNVNNWRQQCNIYKQLKFVVFFLQYSHSEPWVWTHRYHSVKCSECTTHASWLPISYLISIVQWTIALC